MKSKHDGWTPEEQVETQEQITPLPEPARTGEEIVCSSARLAELESALRYATIADESLRNDYPAQGHGAVLVVIETLTKIVEAERVHSANVRMSDAPAETSD